MSSHWGVSKWDVDDKLKRGNEVVAEAFLPVPRQTTVSAPHSCFFQELSLTAYGSPLETGPNNRGEQTVKLSRYEIVRELGKGAMGVVYLAKDPLIGRLVALKTIRMRPGDDDDTKEFQQRFVREAQAAGILNHPAIVTVHDIGQDEPTGTSFIAMEYVEGH